MRANLMSLPPDPAKYDYGYPAHAIATRPASPRDAARLFVYDKGTGQVSLDTFKRLGRYLPKGAVLVCNNTKVLPARLMMERSTGGRVELLYLSHEAGVMVSLANRRLRPGESLSIPGTKLIFFVGRALDKGYEFKFSFPPANLFTVLHKYGQAPLPPYIKQTTLSKASARREYQTVFAKTMGSVAAPTAGLHFTKQLVSSLRKAGVKIEYVTLHVGLGTFAPLTDEHLRAQKLHQEYYQISPSVAKRLQMYKQSGRQIVAVGTTVARTLESAFDHKGDVRLSGQTDLFIYPPYQFRMLDGLITNFHVPKSSLMMLVASLIGRTKLLELYRLAIAKKFRLFSFGDAMLVMRSEES